MTTPRPSAFMAGLTPEQLRDRLRGGLPSQAPSYRLEAAGRTGRIHVYGLIGGWFGDVLASSLVPEIRELDVDTIELYLNSPGGDAYDGIAIRNALRQHSARVEVHVDGIAASAASVIATAGDEVIMGPGTELMIHDAWNVVAGDAAALRAEADNLDRLSDNVAALYAEKAGGTAADWRSLMVAETWYTAEEAVEAGLADRVDGAAQDRIHKPFDLSAFAHAGRAAAPAPAVLRPAALAPTERKNTEMNRAQLAAALAAGDITQAEHDAYLAQLDAFEAQMSAHRPTPPAADPADTEAQSRRQEVEAGPQLQTEQPRPPAVTETRMTDPREFDRRMAAAGRDLTQGDPRRNVLMALADVIPSDDAGEAFVTRPDFIGQTWRADDDSRPWIDALGEPLPMTAITTEGWNWGVIELDENDEPTGVITEAGPEVDDYLGDKTELPSNEVKTFKQDFDSFMIASAWDIERRYIDFGSERFWASFREWATKSYKRKSNLKVRALIRTAAPDAATGGPADVVATSVSNVLKQLRGDIRSVAGAHANRVFLGSDLYDLIEDLPIDSLPLWLKNASVGAGPDEGKASTGQLFIQLDTGLAAKESVVFDSRGIKYRERSPFWIDALNVPHGGIDLGVHSYGSVEIHDERVIKKRVYA